MPHRSWLRWLSCSLLVTLVSCAQALSPPIATAPTTSSITASSPDALTLNNKGVGKLQQQDYQGAIADFSSAIQLQPDLVEAYLGRGIAYSVSRNHKAAIADYDKALTLKPDFAEAYLNRADDLFFLQQKDKAIADLQHAKILFAQHGDTATAKLANDRLIVLRSPTVKPRDTNSALGTAPTSPTPIPEPTVAAQPKADGLTPIRASVTGSCDCPYDFASDGSHCGGRSAYSRPGGRDPVCYKDE